MRGNLNFDRIKAILDRLLSGNVSISKEISIFNKLFKRYPDWQYWENLLPDKTTNSMAWYLSKWGDPYLKKQWLIFKKTSVNDQKDFVIDNTPNIDNMDIKTEKKKSVIDLLK